MVPITWGTQTAIVQRMGSSTSGSQRAAVDPTWFQKVHHLHPLKGAGGRIAPCTPRVARPPGKVCKHTIPHLLMEARMCEIHRNELIIFG